MSIFQQMEIRIHRQTDRCSGLTSKRREESSISQKVKLKSNSTKNHLRWRELYALQAERTKVLLRLCVRRLGNKNLPLDDIGGNKWDKMWFLLFNLFKNFKARICLLLDKDGKHCFSHRRPQIILWKRVCNLSRRTLSPRDKPRNKGAQYSSRDGAKYTGNKSDWLKYRRNKRKRKEGLSCWGNDIMPNNFTAH